MACLSPTLTLVQLFCDSAIGAKKSPNWWLHVSQRLGFLIFFDNDRWPWKSDLWSVPIFGPWPLPAHDLGGCNQQNAIDLLGTPLLTSLKGHPQLESGKTWHQKLAALDISSFYQDLRPGWFWHSTWRLHSPTSPKTQISPLSLLLGCQCLGFILYQLLHLFNPSKTPPATVFRWAVQQTSQHPACHNCFQVRRLHQALLPWVSTESGGFQPSES